MEVEINTNTSSIDVEPTKAGPQGLSAYEVAKKADPTCLRQAFSLACYCIEYFAFAQYNLRYFIVKDDLLYYKEQIDSADGKNTYFCPLFLYSCNQELF